MYQRNFSGWGNNKRYNDFTHYTKTLFSERVQKISINVGFSCPNRDGTKGTGGCIYCDNETFKPGYCKPEIAIEEQIEKGIKFFGRKYKTMLYFAYFQSYTNTYAPADQLISLYEKALKHPKVIGLVISTRPDCITVEILEYLAKISKDYFVTIEYGVESTIDRTLDFINRCHTFEETRTAFHKTASKGIHSGAHLILGLPGESHEDFIHHAKEMSKLPVDTIKLHQLQVIEGTSLEEIYRNNKNLIIDFTAISYVDMIVDFLEYLNPEIVVERFISVSPPDRIITPKWGLKNYEIIDSVEKRLVERNTWQGRLYSSA